MKEALVTIDKETGKMYAKSFTDLGLVSNRPPAEPITLKFYHVSGRDIPKPSTSQSAGMDIRADFTHMDGIKLFTSSNEQRTLPGRQGGIWLEPGDRALIPTGIHADIPDDFALLIYPRSGTSWKQGLTITNSVGLVDSDYVEEIFVSLMNSSRIRQWINQDDRIAQLVLMPVTKMPIERITSKPEQKTDRNGGFGSTGSK